MALTDDLIAAGFSDTEITEYTTKESEKLSAAGFSDSEVSTHIGGVKPYKSEDPELYNLPEGASRPISAVTTQPVPTAEERFAQADDLIYKAPSAALDAISPFFMSSKEEKSMMAKNPKLMAARYAAASLILPGVSEKLASPSELEAFVKKPTDEQRLEILGLSAGYMVFGAAMRGASILLQKAAVKFPWMTKPIVSALKESAWWNKLTNKERGVVTEKVAKQYREGMTDGEVLRFLGKESKAYQQAMKARIVPERPVADKLHEKLEPKPPVEVKPAPSKPVEVKKPEVIKVKEVAKPAEVPVFKSTNEALEFGLTATPEQITVLKERYKETEAIGEKLLKKKKIDEAIKVATEAQFYREAFQAKDIVKEHPEFAPKIKVVKIKEKVPIKPIHVYRGGLGFSKAEITDKGISLTLDREVAEKYKRSGKIEEYYLPSDAKIFKPKIEIEGKQKYLMYQGKRINMNEIAKKARADGYDAVDFTQLHKEIRVVNPDILKATKPKPSTVTTPAEIAAERKAIARETKGINEQTEINLRISAAFKVAENLKASEKAEDIRAYKSSVAIAKRLVRDNPIYRLITQAKRDGGLNYRSLGEAGIGKDDIANLAKRHPGLVVKTGGSSADSFANEEGFDDPSEMVETMMRVKKIPDMIKRMAKDEFAEYERSIDEARDLTLMERILDEEIKVLRKSMGKPPATRKDLKATIRKETGLWKLKNIVEIEDREVIRTRLLAEVKTGRKAFIEGRKAGVLKHKESQREILERRRAKKQIKEYFNKLVKQIKKPTTKRMDFYYAEAVRNIQAGIDTKLKMQKTLTQRDEMRAFLKHRPKLMKHIPAKFLQELNKKNVQEYTIDELRTIAQHIKALRFIGREIYRDRELARVAEIKNTTAKILKGTRYAKEIPDIEKTPQPISAYTNKQGIYKKIKGGVRAVTLTPARVMDIIDGGQNFRGAMHRVYVDKTTELVDNELRNTDIEYAKVDAALERFNIKLKEFTKEHKIDGIVLSNEEMMGVYLKIQNDESRLAMTAGNEIPEATLSKFINKLDPKFKAYGDWVINWYEETYPRNREAHIETTNEDLKYVPRYTPMETSQINYRYLQDEVKGEVSFRKAIFKAFPDHNFTKHRIKDIPEKYRNSINLKEHQILLKHIAKREHYAQFAPHIKLMHNIISQPLFRRVVRTKFGDTYLTELKKYVDDIANPNLYRTFGAIENVSRTIRKHTVIAYLAYNIVTYGKQLPSVFFGIRDAGFYHFMAAAAEMQTHPLRLWREVRVKDPQVKHRSLERELEELKQLDRAKYDSLINRFGKAGMRGIYLIDGVAVTIHWKAVYNKEIAKGSSEMEARRQAQNSFLRYQPTSHPKDIAAIYRTSEFLNWPLQFTSQLNKIYNTATYDIPVDIKTGVTTRGKEGREALARAFLATTGLAISAVGIWIMTEKRFPDEPLDVAKAVRDQAINMVPIGGKAISAAHKGWWSQQFPIFKPFEAAGVAIAEKATLGRKVKVALEAAAVARGIPYTGTRRIVKAIQEEDILQLIGGFGEIDLKKLRKGTTRLKGGSSVKLGGSVKLKSKGSVKLKGR